MEDIWEENLKDASRYEVEYKNAVTSKVFEGLNKL